MLALPLHSALLLYQLRRPSRSALGALVESAVLWGVLVLLLTELLSIIHMVTWAGVTAGWVLLTLVFAVRLWHSRGGARPESRGSGLARPACATVFHTAVRTPMGVRVNLPSGPLPRTGRER
jgi:hypothetical protein